MAWTLTSGAVTKTLAEWGISDLRRRRSSQAVDGVSFALDVSAFDGDPPFAAGSEISIARDGTGWFRGRVISIRPEASGESERITYEIAGPWWYLDRLVYQQTWQVYGVGPSYRSHCLLNTLADGSAMTTRAQIHDALEWARSRAEAAYGASPFQWVQADLPSQTIPADEVRDVTCAEVVRKQLRWVPDAVCWFDYSTTPPTFHCRRRSNLTGATISLDDQVTAVRLVPRYDLQVPSVVIKFEAVNDVDGVKFTTVSRQNAPPEATGEEFGALCTTIDLQGATVSSVSGTIDVQALPSLDADWLEWLKAKHPTLLSDRVSSITLTDVSRYPTENPAGAVLDNELVNGTVAEWMPGVAQAETVLFRVTYTTQNAAGTEIAETRDEEFAVNIVTTDLESDTYTSIGEVIAGEAAPAGLASWLYDALSVLEWDGVIVTAGEDVQGAIGIGHKLGITGGRAEWETMAAVVQEVSDDVDQGISTISVGPPNHLGPRDMVELLRVGRFRQVRTPPALRASGAAPGGGSSVTLGTTPPKENAVSGVIDRSVLAVGKIILDASDAGSVELRVRSVDVCVDGVQKQMLFLCSEPLD